MTIERMLEFLTLSEVFKTTEEVPVELETNFSNMYERYSSLRDEIINNYKLPITPITNPLQDIKEADA